MIEEQDPKRLAQIALVVLLIIGCITVLLPFVGAVLFAFVVWICTWRFYAEKLLPLLGGRDTLGASLMTLALVLIMLLPTLFLAGSLANGADKLIDFIKPYIEQGLPANPPGWLSGLPFVGGEIDTTWHRLAGNREELNAAIKQLVAPARQTGPGPRRYRCQRPAATGAGSVRHFLSSIAMGPRSATRFTSARASWAANWARTCSTRRVAR